MNLIAAAIQMNSQNDVAKNLMAASELIHQAVNQGAKLIVLPENFAFIGETPQAIFSIAEKYGAGTIQDFLTQQAFKHKIWIVGGSIPLLNNHPNKIRSACLVYNETGTMVARYDKLHLFDVIVSENEIYKESDVIEAGETVTTIDSPLGKLGVAICYDVRFPELFKVMFNQGVEIIALPSAFTIPTGKLHWEVLVRARAIDIFSYVIAAAQTGTHSNRRQTFGNSMIVAPTGTVISRLENQVDVITAEIDIRSLEDIRHRIPVGKHQRIAIDHSTLSK